MAKKPDAARGKATRIGKIKKIAKNLIKGAKPKISMRTKAKRLQNMMKKADAIRALKKPRRGLSDILKSAPRGAGASGAAMTAQAMKLAKKMKPTGRVNMDDIKRVKQMMMKRKGK